MVMIKDLDAAKKWPIIYSVPGSGTRFLMRLLQNLGKGLKQIHTAGGEPPHPELEQFKLNPVVVPVRHPYDVLDHHWRRAKYDRPEQYLDFVVKHFEELVENEGRFPRLFHFRYTVPVEDRRAQMDALWEHLAEHMEGEKRRAVWYEQADEWPMVGHAYDYHEHGTFPEDKSRLDFAVEHFGYRTQD